jgi:choline dehydrogenase
VAIEPRRNGDPSRTHSVLYGVNNHVDALAALRTNPALPAPDVHILFMDFPFTPPGMQGPHNGYTIAFSLLSPYSRGSVRLASGDPDIAPLIDPGFLTDPRDIDSMLAGLRLAREIGQAPAMAAWHRDEALPGAPVTTTDPLRVYLRRSIGTYNHPIGTCLDSVDA